MNVPWLLFFMIFTLIGPAVVSYHLAREKGRTPTSWVVLGLIPGVGFYTMMYLVGTRTLGEIWDASQPVDDDPLDDEPFDDSPPPLPLDH